LFWIKIMDQRSKSMPAIRLITIAIVMIGFSVAFFLYRDKFDSQLLLIGLGILGILGIFFLVSLVTGLIGFAPKAKIDPLALAILDNQPQGIVISDRKDRVIYGNNSYRNLVGLDQEQDLKSIGALLAPDAGATETVYRLSSAMRAKKSAQEEFRLDSALGTNSSLSDHADGAHWYRLGARPFSVSGDNEMIAWELTDITNDRADQERVFKELQYAIDYLDHAPVGFFSADHDGKILYLNATLTDWLSIDLTSFQSGTLTIQQIVAGEGIALINSVQAEPGLNTTAQLDLDLLKTNGQSFPVRLVHKVTTTRDGAPGESRTIVVAREADHSTNASSAAAEMRFTRFFDNTPMSIASVDADGKILRTNAPFLKMFDGIISRHDIESGARLETLFRQDDIVHYQESLALASDKQGNIAPIDVRHPSDDDRYFRFYVNAIIEQGNQESRELAIIYVVETTEQKAFESQMAQTQKMNAVGTLAGGIAHDFNNVLTAILLSSDHLLLSSRPADSDFADLMEIKRNANRAAVLVRQLLAFSRKQTMRPSVLSMTDVVGDLRMLVDRLTGTNVGLEVEFGKDVWPVKTDLGQFEQVLVNLAVNARDAMPEGGKVKIRTRNVEAAEVEQLNYRGMVPGEYVLVEVEDEGTGIAPDVLEQIFEPFFTTKDVGKGTGLGLSMVYGIIKQSGGFIYPVSEVGKGTTFCIFLPRHIEEIIEQTEEQVAAAAKLSAAQKEKKSKESSDLTGDSAVVLLVEDEEAVRRGGKRMLQTRGYDVHEAGNGVEALEILAELKGKVDIVVSDVVMPEMDGPTLLRELRKDYPDIKFIFVSGYAEDAFAKNLPEGAKFGFLPKPFSLKQLATSVREMLDN
jgi:two-component system cell cycle sensor histidine kinase/response regulator CckA